MTKTEIQTAIKQVQKDKESIQASIDALEKQLIGIKTGDKFRSIYHPEMVYMVIPDKQVVRIESNFRHLLGLLCNIPSNILTDPTLFTKIN